MSSPSLEQAITRVIRRFLDRHADLAPSIAVIADFVAAAARAHGAGTVNDATTGDAAAGGQVPAAPGANVSLPAISASAPAGGSPSATAGASAPGRPLSSGFVPLKLADNSITHVRVQGTGEDIAAARFSAEPARPAEEDDVRRFRPPDLELIRTRCLLKAEGCRAAIDRRAATGTATEQEQVRRIGALITQGKQLDNCYLWMVNRAKPQADDQTLQMIAATYENLASAAQCCERVPAESRADRRTRVLLLLAEAQSALRVALTHTWLSMPDKDQDDAFRYLDNSTTYEQVFIARHMKLSDPADPAAWQDLRERIAAFTKELDQDEELSKATRATVNRVRHHAKAIAADPGADHSHDWGKIDAALVALSAAGRGRDPEVMNLLRPVAGIAPRGEQYPALERVLGAMAPEAEVVDEEGAADRYSADVARVRGMLRGSRVVIIGGERREDAVVRIREAFELSELEWVMLPEHGSTAPAEAPIRRTDTRLVLLLIRLAGHLHTEEVSLYCERHGKPLIRLPAGYNPERIAAEILQQASGKLAAQAG